jgi:hypothetical protein
MEGWMRKAELISRSDLLALEGRSTVLAQRRGHPKVFEAPDGLIWKVFDSRLHWSLLGLHRKAQRFIRNSHRLSRSGIPCPEVLRMLCVDEPDEHVLVYRSVLGQTLREALETSGNRDELRTRLASFIARLHELGVYFGGGHLGNYILMPDGHFGVIDIQDVWGKPLFMNAMVRANAFRILLKYPKERELLSEDGHVRPFVESYFEAAEMSAFSQRIFLQTIHRRFPEIAVAFQDMSFGSGGGI